MTKNVYEKVGQRFDNNDEAVGNVLTDYMNASQVIQARLNNVKKKKKMLNSVQIARLKA